MTRRRRPSRAFSLVEVLVVVVVLGILAAVSVPVVAGAQTDARTGSAANTAAGVRAAISAFRQRAVIEGEDPFPTLAELTTPGTVLDRPLAPNPWSGLAAVREATLAEAQARTVVSAGAYGWAYHVNNASSPPVAIFYANSTDETARLGDDGAPLTANEL